MKKYILGLDINDSFLAAVVLGHQGRERHVIACDSIALNGQQSLSEMLPRLLERISWKGRSSVCGISLSDISIRNLTIPFADRKKINQVLSFELEDQLITPVSRQIVEYIFTGQAQTTSHILITAVEKEKLRHYFTVFEESRLIPDVVGLRLVALAVQSLLINKTTVDSIFLDAGLQSMNVLFCHRGEVVFLRHLAYPEEMITEPPFSFTNGRAGIASHEEAMACIANMCGDINRSLGFFRLESGVEFAPEKIVITGSLGQVAEVRESIQSGLAVPVVLSNIREEAGIFLNPDVQEKWDPGLYDFALCLALEGLQKKHLINFRKDEFSQPQMLFTSKGRLLAASIAFAVLLGAGLVYLGLDYHYLRTRYEEMGGQMQALFKDTFPDRTRISDPLVEMQASIKNIQAPSVAIPVFTGSKRSLNILADISGRIPPAIEIEVSRLVIDQESVQIKGSTDNFNNVNIIQNNLRRSPLFRNVNIISAAADRESTKIRFELRMETGGA
ncbi:MAG: PilN domain-containing protein [Desulfobulbaceae bacterium]|nr:PilN domain-containing protein [Desulfobulbaceae bacterium]